MVSLLAAAAVLVFAARALLDRNNGANTTPSTSDGAAHAYATAVGQRDSVRLPDGGRVVLGPASQLVVAAGYGERVREVELHGVAYFDVAHDPRHPFVVRAGATVSEDEIIDHAREWIAGYKLPKSVEIRTESLPLSGAMKVLKRELREPYWAGRDRAVN